MKNISEDEGVYLCIYLQQSVKMDENNIWNFNLRTQEGMSIHFNDAFEAGKL